MASYAAIIYGLGGAVFDPPSGERQLTARLKAMGVDVGASPYGQDDTQGIVDFLFKKVGKRMLIGDSLGANNAPFYAGQLNSLVDYIAGFQPSLYGQHYQIPDNVVRAHCIYDPNWIQTGGLGAYKWELAKGNTTTKLMVTEAYGAHPYDWGAPQDMVFNDVKGIIG